MKMKKIAIIAAVAVSAMFATSAAQACSGGINETVDWSWIGGPASVELETPICSFASIGTMRGGAVPAVAAVAPTVPVVVVDVPVTEVITDPEDGGPTPTEGTLTGTVPANLPDLTGTEGVTVVPGPNGNNYILTNVQIPNGFGIPAGTYSGHIFNGTYTVRIIAG